MPILLRMVHNDLTNPITAVHFVPTLSISLGKAAGCGLHKIIKCTNRDIWFVTVAIVTATWGIKAWEPALAHPVTQASCIVCTENAKMRSSRFHHVFCDFALHPQICRYSDISTFSNLVSHPLCTARTKSSALEVTPIHPFPGRRITMPTINPAAWKSFSVKCWQIIGLERFLPSGLDWIWLNDHEMMIWFDCNLFFIGNLSDLFEQSPYGMCLTLFKKSLAARHHSVSDTAGKDGAKDVPWPDFQTLRWSTANIVTANSWYTAWSKHDFDVGIYAITNPENDIWNIDDQSAKECGGLSFQNALWDSKDSEVFAEISRQVERWRHGQHHRWEAWNVWFAGGWESEAGKMSIRFFVTMMLESDLIACSNRSCNWRHSNFMPAMRSRYCKIGKSRRSSLGRQFVFVCPAKEQNEPFKQQSQWQVALTRSAKFGFAVSGLRRLRRPQFCRTASTAGQIWSCCVDAKLNNEILRSYSASPYPEIVPWPCQPLSVAKQH